ncbi:MAG: (d)CMP kinase [Pelosinus sp.]|nr:(d)CMP kinase [Pelosinus sp.]
MKKLVVAIDGPAGAGKSTVARMLAKRLNYIYIDTGAMYRAITFEVISKGLSPKDDEAIAKLAQKVHIELKNTEGAAMVLVDGKNVTEEIRTPEVSRLVPEIAQNREVRQAMLLLQRRLASQGGVVMDGRDIGTNVLPNAEVKIFLTASIEERAQRRYLELKAKGFAVHLEDLKQEIAARDKQDSERPIAPLVQAADAKLLDTTSLAILEVVTKILNICEERASIV